MPRLRPLKLQEADVPRRYVYAKDCEINIIEIIIQFLMTKMSTEEVCDLAWIT